MRQRRSATGRTRLWVLLTGVTLLTCSLSRAAVLPHSPLVPTTEELRRIARVRALLATSTPTHRNPVHIVFYGQSITLTAWWTEVAAALRRLYPDADLRIENKAIAGFQDHVLARTVQVDLAPLQPDLVILHAYGDGTGTDQLLGTLRATTVSDIVVQTDHPVTIGELSEETDPTLVMRTNAVAYRNYVVLPDVANRRDACLARVRDAWKAYCRSNDLAPSKLVADNVHPNVDGNHLMAEFVLAYLRSDTTPPAMDPWNCPKVRSARIGADVEWHDGILQCDFSGSTMAATLGSPISDDIEVWVDEQRVASLATLIGFTRVSPTHHYNQWPTLSHLASITPLLEETWTFTPFNISADGRNFAFRVEGSLTGADGEGTNTLRFVSRSGRVVIEPVSHWIPLSVLFMGGKPLPDGFQATWKAQRHARDPLLKGTMPPADFGSQVQLFQGLGDGPHRLRLVCRGPDTLSISALRTYSPSGQAMIRDSSKPGVASRLRVFEGETGPVLSWPAELTGLALQSAAELSGGAVWEAVPNSSIQTVGTRRRYQVPPNPASQFFRLGDLEEPNRLDSPPLAMPPGWSVEP